MQVIEANETTNGRLTHILGTVLSIQPSGTQEVAVSQREVQIEALQGGASVGIVAGLVWARPVEGSNIWQACEVCNLSFGFAHVVLGTE